MHPRPINRALQGIDRPINLCEDINEEGCHGMVTICYLIFLGGIVM